MMTHFPTFPFTLASPPDFWLDLFSLRFLCQAQVEQLELRVQELQAELLASRTERSEELQELHAIVDAQEAPVGRGPDGVRCEGL